MNRVVRKLAVALWAVVLVAGPREASAQQISNLLTAVTESFSSATNLLSLISYIAGTFWVVYSVLKLKDHVDSPQHHSLALPIKGFIAAGLFLALPFATRVVTGSLFENAGSDNVEANDELDVTAFGGEPTALDAMVVNFMNDVSRPMHIVLDLFVYIFGGAFLLIGIHRLTQKMEQGPRGPAGMGTIMTFVTAGAFLAMGDMASAFTNSVFNDGTSLTQATVDASLISDANDRARVGEVIQAVMLFVMVVGAIAFIRGWLVLRAFADGQQGATLAQGLTFLFGGVLAMNLGDLVNALQATLGITGTITFS